MPHWAPLAAKPRISIAPRLAEMNANPVTQAGSDRPARKKSTEELTTRFSAKPIPITQTKKANNRTRSSPPSSRTSLGASGAAAAANHVSWARLMPFHLSGSGKREFLVSAPVLRSRMSTSGNVSDDRGHASAREDRRRRYRGGAGSPAGI